ncbi:MAG: Tex family protein [Parachlamydiaceae bacterium]
MTNEKDSSLFIQPIALELSIPISSVAAVIKLFDEGNTIPFIARYRKEATGNLDEVYIKNIQERLAYLQELAERKKTILSSIASQGKLTDTLRDDILSCQLKTVLEDLYLPYKPKRRTRAMIAKEKGLEPLADLILKQPLNQRPEHAAAEFIDIEKGVKEGQMALAGARDIVAEKISENASIRALVREEFFMSGTVVSKRRAGKGSEPTKFEQYYDFKEAVRAIPSHRYLAIRRGEREDILDLSIHLEVEHLLPQIENVMGLNTQSPFSNQLKQSIEDALHRLILPSIETDIRVDLKMSSDKSAVTVFADNIRNLLLAPPMGGRLVIGIDPGIRTGCKCAVVDATGKYIDSITIYLSQGESGLQQAKKEFKALVDRYPPYAIAIGNGTAGRETQGWVKKILKEIDKQTVLVVAVNESGASVYSASEIAREEFPDLDITIRGAISIARRLQDPLAELVKIEPKSIGVGQYQHDVHQSLLQDELHHVVETCVNHVGVDLNTASYSLLTYVSGIGPSLARKMIKHREHYGPFKSRSQLLSISGFGAKTFEQAAGFLRIRDGENPLDASAVHPERYEIVQEMARNLHTPLEEMICNPKMVDRIDYTSYAKILGEHTMADIIEELKKPGRDPRSTFTPPSFRDDVMSIEDLKVGMKLEGIVTNVTAFGAFVDIGVHQDGLVHLSELSDEFVKDPQTFLKAADKIHVEVLQVDIPRKRISLTARIGQKREHLLPQSVTTERRGKGQVKQKNEDFFSNPFSTL